MNTLRDAGYEGFKTWEIESNRNPDTGKTVKDPNRFVTCTINGVKLYAYHFPAYNETRLIVDTQADTVEGYVYEAGPAVAQVSLTSYGLSISENGYDITTTTINSTGKRNCGALVVIRMPDNSVFINDGGDIQQWNDEISADFMKYLRQLTGTPAGEKVVVNTWFVSHAHSDHFLGFPQFLARHHEELDLKNVMYSIDIERFFTTRDISGIMSTIRSFYPNVRYYKPHTGETIEIAGVKMDVLYTLEDRYLPNDEGKLITDYPKIENGQAVTSYDVGGTYRSNMYETDGKSDFNDTSVVLRVHLYDDANNPDNSVDSILYADANLAENVIMNVYPDEALETDIMMIPHHGHDAHRELCRLSNAKIFLYTQHKQAIFGPDGDVSTKDDVDANGVATYRNALRKNYLEMQPYIETKGSQTYWEGNETVCIMVGDNVAADQFPETMTKTTAPAGFTVYSSPAPTYVYEEPKSEESAPSLDAGSGWSGGLAEVTTNTKTFRFDLITDFPKETVDKVETVVTGGKYVIVDGDTDNVFMHDPVNHSKSSMLAGTSTQAENGQVEAYFKDDTETKLYFTHHDRDQAMWILSKTITFTSEGKTESRDIIKLDAANFGGKTAYRYVGLYKGLYSAAEPYWTATGDADSTWLQPNKTDLVYTPANVSSPNVFVEFFSDGTCLIYYYGKSGKDVRFLYCDANGKWSRKVYEGTAAANKTAIANDLSSLKLRLYSEYIAKKALQTVAYDGQQQHTVLKGTSEATILVTVASGITVRDTSRKNVPIPYSATPKVGYYHLALPDGFDSNQAGDYMVDIYYRNDDGTDTKVGGVTLHVVERVLVSATINNNSGIVSKGSNVGTHVQSLTTQGGSVKDCTITATFRNADGSETTETVCVSVGMLTYGGKPIDTNQVGFYNSVTVTYRGQKLTNAFNLTVSDSSDYLNYPVYPEPGSVIVNKQGTTSEKDFALTGVANIQLSATGIPTGKGVDLIVVVDLSGSMENAVDTNDDAPVGDRRIDIATRAIKNMVAQLRTMPGADVRIAMSDFGDLDSHDFQGVIIDESIANEAFFDVNFNNSYARRNAGAGADYYEFSNYLNFPFKDSNHDDGLSVNGSDPDATAYTIVNSKFNIANPSYMGHTIPGYSGKVIPTIYTGSGQANADAFVNVSTLDANAMDAIEAAMWNNVRYSIGTNYDVGLEYAYQLGYAIQQQNIAEGLDREVVCIFMSDGAPMQFNYFSGRAVSSTWSDWITGNADGIHQVHAEYTKDNKPADLVKIEKILMARLKKATWLHRIGAVVNCRMLSISPIMQIRPQVASTSIPIWISWATTWIGNTCATSPRPTAFRSLITPISGEI